MGNYSAVRQFTHYPNIRRCTAEALQYGKKRCKKVPNEELHRATKRVIDTLEQLSLIHISGRFPADRYHAVFTGNPENGIISEERVASPVFTALNTFQQAVAAA